jgi:hypothetical protein
VNLGRIRSRALVIGALLLFFVGCLFALSGHFASQGVVKIRLKRYGRTIEGDPVAWLILTNTSESRIQLWADLNPVPTAVCDYKQQVSNTTRTWTYTPPSLSGGMWLGPTQTMTLRVLLPTNGLPVTVSLHANIQNESLFGRRLRPVRLWLYRHRLLSPVTKIPVPFELKSTNIVTRFVH